MSRNGPNKTVARARRAMGGFAAKQYRPDQFMDWVAEQARAGKSFASEAEARAEFERQRER